MPHSNPHEAGSPHIIPVPFVLLVLPKPTIAAPQFKKQSSAELPVLVWFFNARCWSNQLSRKQQCTRKLCYFICTTGEAAFQSENHSSANFNVNGLGLPKNRQNIFSRLMRVKHEVVLSEEIAFRSL
ncbi:unnamed protein product [Amaranthus hypochondriacus]